MSKLPQPRHWPQLRPVPLALGLAMAGVTIRVILDDTISAGAPVSISHVMSLAVLVAVIGAGHFAGPQLRAGRLLSAIGLGVVFLAGTIYLVTMSGARNGEVAATKAAAAADNNTARERELKQLARAEQMHAETADKLQADCVLGKKLKGHCDGIRASLAVYDAAVRGHKATLKDLGPERPASAYRHAALVLAAFPGVTAQAADIEGRLALLMPYLVVLIVEIGTVVFLGMAVVHRPRASNVGTPTISREVRAEKSPEPTTPRPRRGRKADKNVLDFSAKFRAKHGRAPSGAELRAEFPALPKSTASDYARRVRGAA